ncbi:SCO2322 family protein [Streptomyces sp. I05A-00742]|uniref:SCO2322 family protein n=1 Tax=Streptomyces sp. I05A-00742 TaxID=2732853 RepID=UPI0014880F10|nr:SCO2322 family protein [Streptomyces sp. I05A-00742]
MTAVRATGALLLAGLLAVLPGLLGAAPAQAAGFRYWSFWQADGKDAAKDSAKGWTYATRGPSQDRPGDGDAVGFRFAVSADSRDAAKPRTAPDFAAVCDRTPAREGRKRVAVVLDFGTDADAPDGERPPAARTACAQVTGDATAADALAAVAKPLRYNSDALLCAIAGYPRKGCGEQVGAERPAGENKKDDGDDGGPSAGLIGGAAAVVVLGAAAAWQARRRRAR